MILMRKSRRISSAHIIGIIGLAALFLILFFFPKDAGSACGFCPPFGVYRTEHGCIGFKQYIPPEPGCIDCGTSVKCFGIITAERKCYGRINADAPETEKELPCDFAVRDISCSSDSDCVAGGSCCHPQDCVNKNYAYAYTEKNCKGIGCTEICMSCPVCKCVNNLCAKVGTKSIEEGGCC